MPQRAESQPSGLGLVHVSAGYGPELVIEDIHVTLPHGKLTALVGANGCGKSTLLSTIARLLKPRSGCVWLDGKQIHQQPGKAVARQLGILPQSPVAPEGLTVFELVSRGRYPWQGLLRQWSDADEQAVEKALQVTGTHALAHLPVESLSGGQRQRCWIAMALAQQTQVILLDEPTAWLDLRYQVEILELLQHLTRDHGRTVVVVLHDLNFAVSYADRLLLMKQGRLHTTLEESGACTPEIIQEIFGVGVQKVINPETGRPFFIPSRSPFQ